MKAVSSYIITAALLVAGLAGCAGASAAKTAKEPSIGGATDLQAFSLAILTR
jgi:hypothetical protein